MPRGIKPQRHDLVILHRIQEIGRVRGPINAVKGLSGTCTSRSALKLLNCAPLHRLTDEMWRSPGAKSPWALLAVSAPASPRAAYPRPGNRRTPPHVEKPNSGSNKSGTHNLFNRSGAQGK
jgi:hypothetical protein